MSHSLISEEKYIYFQTNKVITYLCGLYFFISFYEGYLNQIIGSVVKYFLVLLIFILLYSYKNITIRTYHFLICGWFVFLIASLWWAGNGINVTVRAHLISQIGMVAFFCVLSLVNFNKLFTTKIIKISMFSSFSLAILGLFFSESYHGVAEHRQVLTLFGVEIDPNNLAAFYLVGFTIALYLVVFEKNKSLILFGVIVVNLLAVGLTGSRGGFVSVLAILLVTIVLLAIGIKNKLAFFRSVFFLGIFLFLVFLLVKFSLPEGIYDRIFSFHTYSGGSERSYLWSNTMELIKQSPIIGHGWGGIYSRTHNTFLTSLLNVGLIGTALLLGTWGLLFFKAFIKKYYLAILIMITGLVPSFFLEAINKRFFWNALFLGLLIINSRIDIHQKIFSNNCSSTGNEEDVNT